MRGVIMEAVADRGYEDEADMAKCLENGIIPHVITGDGSDGYEIEIPYVEGEVKTDSIKPEDLKRRCMRELYRMRIKKSSLTSK